MWVLIVIALSTTKWVQVPSVATTVEFSNKSLCDEAAKQMVSESNVIREAHCVKVSNN